MSVWPIVTKRIGWEQGRLPVPAWRYWSWPTLILSAAGLALGLFMLLPPVYLLIRTLGSGSAALGILTKATTVAALGRTVWLALAVTTASILLAVPLAWLTTCTNLPGRRVWAVVVALPLVVPSYVGAYLYGSMFGPRGMLQQFLEPFGVERLPSIYGFTGAFLTLTLLSYPFIYLTVRASLRRMDPSLGEAARSLGLSPTAVFWRVTLPQLRPSIIAGSLLVALYVLRDFGAVALMRYNTFTYIIYLQYQSFSDRSLAAALALVLVVLTAIIVTLEVRARGRAQYARTSIGTARANELVTLGRWRWPALFFCSSVVTAALILPAMGLLYWLNRGWQQGQGIDLALLPAWNSVTVALLASLVAMVAALPVAILSVRKSNRWTRFLERLTYVGFALPGLVVALAFIFFSVRYARGIYQSLPLLIAAYVVLFVPQAVGAARTSLLQIPKNLEEAGRSLGQRPTAVFRRVTLPLLRPGVLAGIGLVFLTCMKELPATLLLSPLGFTTLATAVWSNLTEAIFAQAAFPALVIILLSSVPLAVLTLRDK
ncbi:MAG TPA: iron ABC transporter permease [Anaerolineae bacterium]|nr:iron ABC transporter permease [Anaerolineae bacterium]